MTWLKDRGLWIQIFTQTPIFLLLAGAAIPVPTSVSLAPIFVPFIFFAVTWVGLLVQRYRPHTGLTIVAVSLLAAGIFVGGYSGLGFVVVCWEAYFISAYIRHHRWLWLYLLLGGALSMLVYFALLSYFFPLGYSGEPQGAPNEDILFGVAVALFITVISVALCWQLGIQTRTRELRLEELRARAELAAVTERTRIAREMHDIVAHSLTAVIAQADGGRYAAHNNPEAAVEALQTISTTGRSALGQMRELLSVLREDDSRDTSAAPGIDRVEELINDARRYGVEVEFSESGERRPLDAARGLTVYRIVQEALTNVMKHAGTTSAHVRLDWRDSDMLRINIDNAPGAGLVDARDFATTTAQSTSGAGLTGMRERARIHGGSARWGHSEVFEHGFNVTVEVPT